MSNDLLKDLPKRIDHTNLKPTADETAIQSLCTEAVEHGFHCVVVNPVWVSLAGELTAESDVLVCSVAGFPFGAARTDVKVIEAAKASFDGATEIDLVANIGWISSDRFVEVEQEIAQVRRILPHNILLKVIIECSEITAQQQIEATKAVANAGAQFVKTSTGFFGGATVEQVKRLREAAGDALQVKASGGIKTLAQVRELLAAGATRIGASGSLDIIRDWNAS